MLSLLLILPVLLALLPFFLDYVFSRAFVVHKSGLIVITGASSGIGRHPAEDLARRGYTVLAGVRKQADFDEIESNRRNGKANLYGLMLDVTSLDSIQSAVEQVKQVLSSSSIPLVALVNNAGVGGGVALEVCNSIDNYQISSRYNTK